MTTDTSPDNLRKFLESDDPATVMMGLEMAKGVGVDESLIDSLVCIVLLDKNEDCVAVARSIIEDSSVQMTSLLRFVEGDLEAEKLTDEQLVDAYNLILKLRRRNSGTRGFLSTKEVAFPDQGKLCFDALVSRGVWNWGVAESGSFKDWLSLIEKVADLDLWVLYESLRESHASGSFEVVDENRLAREFAEFVALEGKPLAFDDLYDFDRELCEAYIEEHNAEWVDPNNEEQGVFWKSSREFDDYDDSEWRFTYSESEGVSGTSFSFEEFLRILNGLGFSLGGNQLTIEHKLDVVSFIRDIVFRKILLQFWKHPMEITAHLDPAVIEHELPVDRTLLGINKFNGKGEYFRFYQIRG